MIASPRLKATERLVHHGLFTLNIGARRGGLADITIGVDGGCDIRADGRFLPFRDATFQQVLLFDVIEHLPRDSEMETLSEVKRILCDGGRLALSTPNRRLLYTLLDPAWYMGRRHHYPRAKLTDMISYSGLRVERCFTKGGMWTCISNLFFFISPVLPTAAIGWRMASKSESEYARTPTHTEGCTIMLVASKVPGHPPSLAR